MSRKHRLGKKDLDRLFKRGKTVKNSFFFVRFLKNSLEYGRMAIIVPAKTLKKAVVRNRLKRIITDAMRTGHILEKSYDFALVITADIVGKPVKEIKRNIEQTINHTLVK